MEFIGNLGMIGREVSEVGVGCGDREGDGVAGGVTGDGHGGGGEGEDDGGCEGEEMFESDGEGVLELRDKCV